MPEPPPDGAGEPWWRRQDNSGDGWDGPSDGPMPTRVVGLARREVPDLANIRRTRWAEVLTPLDAKARTDAALHPLIHDGAAYELVKRLPAAASEAAWAAVSGSPTVPVPEATALNAGKQVNVRIARADWEALQRAANVLGLRPSQLARMLVLNGVRRVLAEHDAAIAAAARAAGG